MPKGNTVSQVLSALKIVFKPRPQFAVTGYFPPVNWVYFYPDNAGEYASPLVECTVLIVESPSHLCVCATGAKEHEVLELYWPADGHLRRIKKNTKLLIFVPGGQYEGVTVLCSKAVPPKPELDSVSCSWDMW